jgi:hypothetical protein
VDLEAAEDDPQRARVRPEFLATLRKLRDELMAAPGTDPKPRYIGAMSIQLGSFWLVVLHDREEVFSARDEDGDPILSLPKVSDGWRAFLCPSPNAFGFREAVALSRSEARLLSRALSHLALADVETTLNLFRESQVLDEQVTVQLQEDLCQYHAALWLNPENAWALAHMGEAYRLLANAWPGSTDDLHQPHRRKLVRFARAIVCFAQSGRKRNGGCRRGPRRTSARRSSTSERSRSPRARAASAAPTTCS